GGQCRRHKIQNSYRGVVERVGAHDRHDKLCGDHRFRVLKGHKIVLVDRRGGGVDIGHIYGSVEERLHGCRAATVTDGSEVDIGDRVEFFHAWQAIRALSEFWVRG